jgi:glycosyltransferase involved in cell wall biosynthesis
MRILISTELLSPYRVDWFDELGKYADVTVLYLVDDNVERDKAWLAKRPIYCAHKLMKGIRIPKIGKISFDFIREISKGKYDIVILDGYGFVLQLLNILFLNKKGIKYFVNVDGILENERNSRVTNYIKTKIFSCIPYFLCGSHVANDILCEYGVKREKIFNHPFTSLYENDIFIDVASKDEKNVLREKLRIKEKKIIVSVGRFSYMNGYGKGYDVVLETAKSMSDDFGWYIIGGEPTYEFEQMVEDAKLHNVHFVNHLDKESLKEYYRASDVFVLMTIGDVWGLVVNEAMACGLPVITTEKCMAGKDLIKNGVNGYIIQVGDEEALKNSIEKIIENNTDNSMGEFSLNAIQPYTIENMAKIHLKAFEDILAKQ